MKRLILTLLSTAAAVTLAAQPDSLDYRGDYYFSKRSQQESLPVRPHHTVMLGNSLTERGAWAEYFPEAHVINRGIGGDCVAGMAARLDSIVAGRPRAIFLMAGVNDLIFSRRCSGSTNVCWTASPPNRLRRRSLSKVRCPSTRRATNHISRERTPASRLSTACCGGWPPGAD